MSDKDSLFTDPERTGPFAFDDQVAQVLPDMLQRSIPGYAALLDLIGVLAAERLSPQARVYDLGCSLGAVTTSVLRGTPGREIHVFAVDSSPAMIERCRGRIPAHFGQVELLCQSVQETLIERAALVVLNFTLQFVPPAERDELIVRIARGLEPGGTLVLSEKTAAQDAGESIFSSLHDGFRRMHGYSDLEIARKRKALEQVLVPDTQRAHVERLERAGLRPLEWFRGLGFVSWLAIKPN